MGFEHFTSEDGSIPIRRGLHALIERGVDVFQEDKAPTGGVEQEMIELVVHHAALREVEDREVVIEAGGKSLDERRLPATWRTVKKVSPTIWKACA